MAPTTPSAATGVMTRPRARNRREPSPLDQLPAWRDLVPVMDPAVVSPATSPGSPRSSVASTPTSSGR